MYLFTCCPSGFQNVLAWEIQLPSSWSSSSQILDFFMWTWVVSTLTQILELSFCDCLIWKILNKSEVTQEGNKMERKISKRNKRINAHKSNKVSSNNPATPTFINVSVLIELFTLFLSALLPCEFTICTQVHRSSAHLKKQQLSHSGWVPFLYYLLLFIKKIKNKNKMKTRNADVHPANSPLPHPAGLFWPPIGNADVFDQHLLNARQLKVL